MFKIAIASLVVCSQMAFGTEQAVIAPETNNDKQVIELFRLSMIKPNRVEEIIQFISEHEIENGGKEANLEEVVSKIKEQVLGDSFIQNFVSQYENFSPEELHFLIDVYKSEAMGKLQELNIKLSAGLFGGIQQTIQETVSGLPERAQLTAVSQEIVKSQEAKKDLVISVTKEQFAKEIEQSEIPVVMDCYAKWCPPCKKMAPIFEELSHEWANQIKFVKLDVDADPTLARELSVRSMPTFLFFKDGKVVGRHVGALPKDDFVEKMKKFIF